MPFPWITPLLSAIANLILGIVVYRRRSPKEVTQVFTFLTVMFVSWNLTSFVLYSVKDAPLALELTRIFRVGSFFLLPAMLHLILALQPERLRVWRTLLVVDYAVASGLVLVNAFGLYVSELKAFRWGYYSVSTRFYDVFTLLLITNVLVSFSVLVHDYQTSEEPRVRLQLKFWLLGAAIGLPLACTNLLPTYGIPIYPLGSLGNAAWAGIVAYAIARHRLMDIDIVITKGMAYAVMSVAAIAPATGLTLWLQRLSFGEVHWEFSFAVLLMFVAVGFSFPAFRARAESRIERSLFGEKHAYRTALSAFTRSIVRILDRDKLLHELTETLTATLRLDRLAICLLDEADGAYSVRYASGLPAARGEFPGNHELVGVLRHRDGVVLRDELEVSRDPAERRASDIARQNGWEVCIPLTISSRLMGFIALGRKHNLEAFYAEDLQLLDTLAAEAAIALENARLYEEIKKSRDIIERTGRLSALGTLAAGIAHEVRNPLVSIQTFFQLAPQRLHDPEFFTSFLTLTAGEVDRIANLITELLSFARSPSHRLEEVEVNDLIERTTLLIEPEARKHRVKLIRLLAAELPNIRADADQVKQVVINLVLNAIQATPAGGTVTVLTRQTTHQGNPFCQIEVRDTGVGMPQPMLDHIFNPFFTTKDQGTGLGLSIAHQIITEHGGFVAVTSEEDGGSSFCVNLPITPADEADPEAELPLRYGRVAKL